MESRMKKPSAPADDNIILLSDDEGDEPKKPIFLSRACLCHVRPSHFGTDSYNSHALSMY